MGEDSKPDEVQVELAPEVKVEGDVEVSLDKQERPKEPEPKYVTLDELEKVRKQLNGLSYLGRKLDEVIKKVDAVPQRSVEPQKPSASQSSDEYDALVQKDWKQAIRKMAQEEAQGILRAEREAEFVKKQQAEKVSVLEQAKNQVRAKYPDIDDPESETAKKYIEILNKNPQYIQNEYGPVLAMRDMEDAFRSEGKLDEVAKKRVDAEVERRTRVATTTVPKSVAPERNVEVLSKEEREICDRNGIKYEIYAQMKRQRRVAGREGVTING